jgi:hypothetical protein
MKNGRKFSPKLDQRWGAVQADHYYITIIIDKIRKIEYIIDVRDSSNSIYYARNNKLGRRLL